MSKSLPVLIPQIPGQSWSCHSCGDCCRSLVGFITSEEKARIEADGWRKVLGVAPFVRAGGGWALNKREDGSCVFLTEDNLCAIHKEHGEEAKPLACRVFPFSLRRVPGGWQASFRFDCPSAAESMGEPIESRTEFLYALAAEMPTDTPEPSPPDLVKGYELDWDQYDLIEQHLLRWIDRDDLSIRHRVVGLARLADALGEPEMLKLRGEHLVTAFQRLTEALPMEARIEAEPPTEKQIGMLRQLAFAHTEHVSLAELRQGFLGRTSKKLDQLARAKKFLRGVEFVPEIPGIEGEARFEYVSQISPNQPEEEPDRVDDLLRRYLLARVAGRTIAGEGYFGWNLREGLTALCLSVAAAGFLARVAAAAGRSVTVRFEDAAKAIGLIDRAVSRLPSLGGKVEILRAGYLSEDDGVARLVDAFRLADAERGEIKESWMSPHSAH